MPSRGLLIPGAHLVASISGSPDSAPSPRHEADDAAVVLEQVHYGVHHSLEVGVSKRRRVARSVEVEFGCHEGQAESVPR